MNRLTTQKRAQILGMMVEGMSIRSITRLTGASKNTVAKLLVDAGQACADYMDKNLRDLPCKRLQVDEIWSFVYAKAKNVPEDKRGEAGDVWTWTAIDADTKLVPSFYLGNRDGECAKAFISDLASRLANRVQLTSDGHKAYIEAVEAAFGTDVDYAMLVKIYGENTEGQKRYSPAECVGTRKEVIRGNPDPKQVSTSFAERQNLNIRMGNRRFTRLTNAFSKKIENHFYALAIYFMHYNFARIHQTLRVSPAMAASVSETLWSMEDIVRMVDESEAYENKQ
ncbi:MAG: IS1 family transposase [Alphaproteobacteria bacterium]|nr:IS1 family transposase [Alphaproteobacteria bacterium]